MRIPAAISALKYMITGVGLKAAKARVQADRLASKISPFLPDYAGMARKAADKGPLPSALSKPRAPVGNRFGRQGADPYHKQDEQGRVLNGYKSGLSESDKAALRRLVEGPARKSKRRPDLLPNGQIDWQGPYHKMDANGMVRNIYADWDLREVRFAEPDKK